MKDFLTSLGILGLMVTLLFYFGLFQSQLPVQKYSTQQELPDASFVAREVISIWKLHDQYDIVKGRIYQRSKPPTEIDLNYQVPVVGNAYEAQYSADVMFEKDVQTLIAEKNVFQIKKANIGDNYLRLGNGTGGWKKARTFRVTQTYLPFEPRELKAADAVLVGGKTHLPLAWVLDKGFRWSLMQISKSATFESSQFFWVEGSRLLLPIEKLGALYLKLQAVTNNQELSKFSSVFQVNVTHPGQAQPAPEKHLANSF